MRCLEISVSVDDGFISRHVENIMFVALQWCYVRIMAPNSTICSSGLFSGQQQITHQNSKLLSLSERKTSNLHITGPFREKKHIKAAHYWSFVRKKTSKLHIIGPLWGKNIKVAHYWPFVRKKHQSCTLLAISERNPLVTAGFPSQRRPWAHLTNTQDVITLRYHKSPNS